MTVMAFKVTFIEHGLDIWRPDFLAVMFAKLILGQATLQTRLRSLGSTRAKSCTAVRMKR